MVTLSKLIAGAADLPIENLMMDSRVALPKSVFFCVKGLKNDGHQFIDQAIANGAICIVHSDPIEIMREGITYVQVENVIEILNQCADLFYGKPSSKLNVIGVTGTNGKSTIALTIKNIYNHYKPTGYIGTISIEYGDVKTLPLLTTPEITQVHHILADMVESGMEAVTLEVSSQGLEQSRVNSVNFNTAIFTNLTHDHLDYHGTMENYFLAKSKLFHLIGSDKTAIINIDDPYGKRLAQTCEANVVSYGINSPAVYMAKNIQILFDKTIFNLHCYDEVYPVETNMVALFNVYNLLAVIAACHENGMKIEDILAHVQHIDPVDGRMERIIEGQNFNVIVDYAHTPDGFEKIFKFADDITPKGKRILSVFGAAGKRDTKKRPILGEIADRYCDMIILTEEDPRGENPHGIAEQIAKGITHSNYSIVEDRYDAIRQALEIANEDDTVLILAKGNETYMYRDFGREPWIGDDAACKEILHEVILNKEETL
jgi:UDP-N-acetylmuramoyl-L-alanyl-D-glutamate--2,6-diaminopimelate ligase